MKIINIIFSSDNNYAEHLGVALCSIFENKKGDYLIDVYVLDGGIQQNNKNKLKFLEEKYSFRITYIKIDTSFFADFYTKDKLPQATYYRIIIPDLLPSLKKVLYLDCDIIVINDIYELFEINIENYFFAAVNEEEFYPKRYLELKIPETEKYFNSGVVLLNMNKWREYSISKHLINFIKENPNIIEFCDQDAMNAIMWGKWLAISYKYNYLLSFFKIHPIDINNYKKDITIIHYTDIFKPWNYLCRNPLRKEYFYYLKKTPWINSKNVSLIILNFLTSTTFFKKIINFLKKIKGYLNKKFY